MLKSLDIDLYLDGYSIEHTNCVDISVSAASGHFNRDNYFFYFFYYSYYNNWGEIPNNQVREQILNKLGLKFNCYEIENPLEYIEFLKSKIDNSIPIIFIPSNKALFYSSEITDGHGVIISGYDTEKSLFIIRDSKIVDRTINPQILNYISSDPIYKMQVTEEMLLDIIIKSNFYFQKKIPFYCIEKINNSSINDYSDLIKYFIANFKYDKDNLIDFVTEFNSDNNELKKLISEDYGYFMRKYQLSLYPFFHIMIKAFEKIGLNREELLKLCEIKDSFIHYRRNVLSVIYANVLREKYLDKEKEIKICEEIRRQNKELYSIICGIYDNKENCGDLYKFDAKLINHALSATVKADSELVAEPNINCKASNVINHNNINWETDEWISDIKNNTHWLEFDLKKPRSITKFIIRHDGRKLYNTLDFSILVSNDNLNWDLVTSIKNNEDSVTVHEVSVLQNRYVRLLITNSCQFDNRARIYEFQIWGN